MVDTFGYTIRDLAGATDSAVVHITVTGLNDPPVANDDAATTDPETEITIDVLVNDTDPDASDTLTVNAAVIVAGGGSVAIVDNRLVYNPGGDYQYLGAGETAFVVIDYTISDNHGATDSARVTVTISGENDAPVARHDTAVVSEDNVLVATGNVLANDTDADGDALVVTNPGTYIGTYGNLVLAADGTYSYVLNNSSTAVQSLSMCDVVADTFGYTVNDGNGGSDSDTLTVNITGEGGPVFTVNEGFAAQPSPYFDPALEADQFVITYSSRILQTVNGTDNPFTQAGSIRIIDYELNEVSQPSFLNTPEPLGYRLFLNFTGAGHSVFGSGTMEGSYDSFTYSLYLDRMGNSNAFLGDRTTVVNGDDVLLANGTLIDPPGGEMHLHSAFTRGDWDIGASVTLTAAGQSFFIDPRPFHIAFDVSGNLNSVVTTPTGFPRRATESLHDPHRRRRRGAIPVRH